MGERKAAACRDVYAIVDALPTEWDQYRRGSITELVGRIYGEVKAQTRTWWYQRQCFQIGALRRGGSYRSGPCGWRKVSWTW